MRGSSSPSVVTLALSLAAIAALAADVAAQARPKAPRAQPTATTHDLGPLAQVAVHAVPPIDRQAVGSEDERRRAAGLPPRYAIPHAVEITPFTHGTFERAGADLFVWRLRVAAPGATSLNFGFTRYVMPEGGRLLVHSADGRHVVRPFTADDNEVHGELWTPPVPGEEVVLELTIPPFLLDELQLVLGQVGYGYRGFGSADDGPGDSGSCNVDVACPIGDPWRGEIPAVAVISTGGSTFCTGFMVNNTANDQTPYFMTANHCGIGAGSAPSLVAFWNYETSTCGGPFDGQLDQFNTGADWLAGWSTSDFTLVRLDDDPDPEWGVTFAGWDRSGADEEGAVAIHHPSTDEKRISFEYDPTSITTYLGTSVPGNGSHVRVADWDVGTTEGGSSGSPLFNPDHQVVGQLHGGYAACGNNSADWYGRFSVSWTGGGTPSTRLSDWLDPLGTGAIAIDTLGGLAIPPSGTVVHEGPVGGPFSNPVTSYSFDNGGQDPIDYTVALTQDFGVLINGATLPLAGTLAPGASLQVNVTLGPAIAGLAAGVHTETILFSDLTAGVSSSQTHVFEVGRQTLHSFTLDADPGWVMQAGWAWGTPLGGGGSSGNPDPTSGATGTKVLGFNLAGDYTNNMPERHLTTGPLLLGAATGARVSFQRWLNVETSTWDHAYFRVSTDGVNWTTVWQNPGAVTDSSWSRQTYDLAAITDGHSNLWLRWTMGSTDGSLVYSGWNVDDVEVSAVVPGTPPVPRTPRKRWASGLGNPNAMDL